MKIENVKGIIWDLDGTLIDSFSIFEQVISQIVTETGHVMPTRQHMQKNYHGSLEETVQQILDIHSAEELNSIVTSFLHKQIPHYEGDLETHLFQDASMLAQAAAKKGIHQLVVTNRAHEGRGAASPKAIVAATVLADCIHEVYPADEVAYRKPDKRSVQPWLEMYGLNPATVIVIGDQFVDAQLALNLGARSILINRHGEIPHLDTLSQQQSNTIIRVDSLQSVILV